MHARNKARHENAPSQDVRGFWNMCWSLKKHEPAPLQIIDTAIILFGLARTQLPCGARQE